MVKKIQYYRVYCNTESAYGFVWSETTPTVCPNNNTHSIDSTTITVLNTVKESADFDKDGKMIVTSGNFTQFGEQRVSMYNAIFQNYALYNIFNTQVYSKFCDNGGTVTGNENGTEMDLNITTTIGSYAVLRSSKVCKYRPGYNIVVRWNCVYDTPVANLLQFGGLGNNGSDIYFCYNGLDFGIRYSTGGFSEVRTFTVTVAENSSRTASVTLNGVLFSVPLANANGNTSFTAYQIANYSYTGWLTSAIENMVVFTATAVGPKSGEYSYSSPGVSTGTFAQKKAGAALTTTFVNRTDWNGSSRMVQDLDPLMRNMYSINYSWYGSGNMTFKVYDPLKSSYETVHDVYFSNLQTEPSLTQPNMYLQNGIASLGSTSAKTIRVAGGFAATEGDVKVNYPIYGISNTRSIAANTNTVLLGIKNRNSINGFTNNSEILIRQISINSDGNKPVKIRVIKNPTTLSSNTTGDYTKWQYVNETESISLVDKTSVTYTGGNCLATYYLPKNGDLMIDLTGKEIYIFKSDIVILEGYSTSISDIDIAVAIVEDY